MPTAIPRRALILLAVLTLVWGTNWPLFPLAVREVSVWTFRAVSVLFAGLFLLAVARARGQSLAIPRRHWPAIATATTQARKIDIKLRMRFMIRARPMKNPTRQRPAWDH